MPNKNRNQEMWSQSILIDLYTVYNIRNVTCICIDVISHTHLVNSRRERVTWDEMIRVMSCSYIYRSCHVMACRHGWFLAWPPCHFWRKEFAGTFSRRHRWVFVGPCHLCLHGPPAFTLWFRVSHTQ
jgi:hypothetical protein